MNVGEYCLTRYRSSYLFEPYRAYCVAWLTSEKMVSIKIKLLLLAKCAHRAWDGLV